MIVDVNVSLSRWPMRRLPCDEPAKLVERLRRWGVDQAWVGSFDGLFHRDAAGVNARLVEECGRWPKGFLVPFGTVNPMLPDWEEDLRRCHEVHGMPGIRLHPNYHGYKLDDPVCEKLLVEAERRGLLVQLAPRVDDVRVQYHLVRVPDTDLKPLADLAARHARLRLMLLNGLRSAKDPLPAPLLEAKNVTFDIAMLELVGGIGHLLHRRKVPAERVVFGSNLPLYNLESALLKLQESDLGQAERAAIAGENARRLLAAKGPPG
jgi:predicted TIM-barrel fold metal-dependent hydrolase